MKQSMVYPNPEVREAKGSIPMWVISLHLEVPETTLRSWLRREMPDNRREKVLMAINEVKMELQQFMVTKITKDSRPVAV